MMNSYKLSTGTIELIVQLLKLQFAFDWDGVNGVAMLNPTDCFVFINGNGKIPNQINADTGEVISYLEGFHFDIQTALNLELPEGITRHFPTTPKHQFA